MDQIKTLLKDTVNISVTAILYEKLTTPQVKKDIKPRTEKRTVIIDGQEVVLKYMQLLAPIIFNVNNEHIKDYDFKKNVI